MTRDPLGALLDRLAREQAGALAHVDAAVRARGWDLRVSAQAGGEQAERLRCYVVAVRNAHGDEVCSRTVWAPAGSVPLGSVGALSALGDRVARELAQPFARHLRA